MREKPERVEPELSSFSYSTELITSLHNLFPFCINGNTFLCLDYFVHGGLHFLCENTCINRNTHNYVDITLFRGNYVIYRAFCYFQGHYVV